MDRYVIFKQTGTHADVLAAIGAADVLRHLEPRIVASEDRFEIQFRRRLLRSDLDAVDPGFSYLVRPQKTPPSLPPERIVQSQSAAKRQEDRMPSPTGAENRMYSILRRMKAFGGPNQIVSRFARMRRDEWAARVWDGFHGAPGFVCASPLVQLFNPQAAKGYALLKPSGTNREDKTKNRWAEPFLEWLRFRGYFEGSAGWFAAGDLRLICPIPADVPYAQFAGTVAAFRDLRLGGTAVKMDCRAVLGLTRLLIERAETYRRPNRSVRGVWVTHYKDMGQAYTLMAMEQLAVPDWFELRTAQHAQQWLQTLEQHDTALRRLTDSHSDEFALLKQYRRTFQARWQESIPEFLEFLAGYGLLLFKRRAQDHWSFPQFTISAVTPILNRDPNLRMILRNRGFVAVAAAVRSATVGAQAARSNGKPGHREIRYGLLSGLRQAGLVGPRELLAAVSCFVSEFNREAARRRCMGLASSHIQNSEMDSFAALLERSDSHASFGPLLCGLASCIRSERAVTEVEHESELVRAIPA
jgi:hypothetical protein